MTQTKMAKLLGVTPGAVAQQVKRGMPMTSADAAMTWRANNMGRRGGRGRPIKEQPKATRPEDLSVPPIPPGEISQNVTDPPEVAAAKELCALTYADAINATAVQQRATAIQAYQRAVDGLVSLNRDLEAKAIAGRTLLHVDQVRSVIAAGTGKIRSLLESLPSSVAAQANPADPELAEAAIRDAVEQMLTTLSNASSFALDS